MITAGLKIKIEAISLLWNEHDKERQEKTSNYQLQHAKRENIVFVLIVAAGMTLLSAKSYFLWFWPW